jgi:hypothetical protein
MMVVHIRFLVLATFADAMSATVGTAATLR